ncbi:MAG: DUF3352 domain-containing protein [Bacteroidia bacterium]|nr:DUF3352 domain-containing protein [Bacteroidia bacterium]
MRRFLRWIFVLLLLGLGAGAAYLFLWDRQGASREAYAFVPADFLYLVESEDPIRDWRSLSATEVWKHLKKSEFFADITESADYLDSLLNSNAALFDMLSPGELLISAHMTRAQEYDFLMIVNLRSQGQTLGKLKPVIGPLLQTQGYRVTSGNYFNYELLQLYDPAERESLWLAVVDNVLLASYTEALVKKGIDQTEKPSVLTVPGFARTRDGASREGQYQLYLNFGTLPQLIRAYTAETPEMLEGLDEILAFSSQDLRLAGDRVELRGNLKHIDSAASFFSVFQDAGASSSAVHQVLPLNTALYTRVGFDGFADFFNRLNTYYSQKDPAAYQEITKNKERMEKLFKIEFERDFFAWMTDEAVTALVATDSGPSPYEYYALLHFDDYDLVQERLAYVVKRIGKSPLKFDEIQYQGYTIKYLELRGFFKLFFRKLFQRIEKPHFTIIDQYVVFANDTTALQRMIDAYLGEQVLGREPAFQQFQGRFQPRDNLFTYIRMDPFYAYLRSTLDAESRQGLSKNQPYVRCFPNIGLQIMPEGDLYRTYLYSDFTLPAAGLSSR